MTTVTSSVHAHEISVRVDDAMGPLERRESAGGYIREYILRTDKHSKGQGCQSQEVGKGTKARGHGDSGPLRA